MEASKNIVVRMAPSPTGNLHVGTARATLFNYLFAKKYGGKFILRIEDTDKERSTKEFEQNIIDGLHWLGLSWDEFYRQSERTEIYVSNVKKMLENGTAYISHEEPKEEGQRSEVIRFKNPNKKIAFDDLIRGTVEFDTTELGDFVIAKSAEEPLYHLAVVVDDHEMNVTHVIRGEDHISNTPRQILIQEAIGATRPVYAHMPLILDADRKKLSKRKHGAAVWVDTYSTEGYLPEALLNFYALLGWNPGTEQEIFSLEELIEAFTIERVQKSSAIFDLKKLRWVNKEHIKQMPFNALRSVAFDKIQKKYPKGNISDEIIKIITDRIEVWSDIDTLLEAGELDYFFNEPTLEKEKIAWKTSTSEQAKAHLEKTLTMLGDKDALMNYATEVGKGDVLWPLRYALSGREKSPDPFTLLSILGEDKARGRVLKAIDIL
jgi:nondiscriminating glutamyl-tRNA synthetase